MEFSFFSFLFNKMLITPELLPGVISAIVKKFPSYKPEKNIMFIPCTTSATCSLKSVSTFVGPFP